MTALAKRIRSWLTGRPSQTQVRPAAARLTTPAERAPLYAAYAAARAREQEIGGFCDDDSIIQYAVKAYKTAEMARLREQVAEAYRFYEDMFANSEDPLTTSYARQLRERLNYAGPTSVPDASGADRD